MSVGIRVKFASMTHEQFDAVNALVDVPSNPPAALIFHVSGAIEEGWHVIDIWESRAAFDAFLQDRVQPQIAASGVELQGPPVIEEFAVHEMFPPR
jgi:quinol monooxygenase YgiN